MHWFPAGGHVYVLGISLQGNMYVVLCYAKPVYHDMLQVVVALLLPETKLVPLEDVHYLFRDHWVWGWFAHRPQAGCNHHHTSNSNRED